MKNQKALGIAAIILVAIVVAAYFYGQYKSNIVATTVAPPGKTVMFNGISAKRICWKYNPSAFSNYPLVPTPCLS